MNSPPAHRTSDKRLTTFCRRRLHRASPSATPLNWWSQTARSNLLDRKPILEQRFMKHLGDGADCGRSWAFDARRIPGTRPGALGMPFARAYGYSIPEPPPRGDWTSGVGTRFAR